MLSRSASGVAAGVPLSIRLKVVDVSEGSAALAGAAVYPGLLLRTLAAYPLRGVPSLADATSTPAQLATVSGDVLSGYTAVLNVPV